MQGGEERKRDFKKSPTLEIKNRIEIERPLMGFVDPINSESIE